MKNTKNFVKRSLALLLALVMCLGLVNVSAFADDVYVLTCKQEEHTHDDDCYVEARDLTCDKEEAEDTEVVEETRTPLYDTVTETVTDEDGNETTVTKEVPNGDYDISYEVTVVPGHSHDDSCYEVTSDLICEIPEHTHTYDECYEQEKRDFETKKDEEGNDIITGVTPPAEFTANVETEDEEGETPTTALVKVTVAADGTVTAKVTVVVNGITLVLAADVEVKEIRSETVNTTLGDAETTTVAKETTETENEDGTTTVITEITYTTTYATEVTTGYYVEYIVTYKIPNVYTIKGVKGNLSETDVEVDPETGEVSVKGAPATLDVTTKKGEIIYDAVPVRQNQKTGQFYVEIDGNNYDVEPVVTKLRNGNYRITWKFVDDNLVFERVIHKGNADLPAGMEIKEIDGNLVVSLTKSPVTITDENDNETTFVIKDGKYYIVVPGEDGEQDREYEVTFFATQKDDKSYVLSWSYEINIENPAPVLPENVRVEFRDKVFVQLVKRRGQPAPSCHHNTGPYFRRS